ncbi:[FeFe] hydrogenase H-cluster radical SAM maturase HydE [Shewanella fidelis]|uniref:[FeFe] hydrogenase H-cluster radical SAM maturase HydE n=1 Tax=Shewanella fidelis TaxID=173509 RepID=A0AAW8NKS7_9GAMM|nr:[FeFe] hydrogenase H-cluster radical SAM maturase HydE [Shewanella fidelis]MDR8523146.1 [FeFe] hydrogenase H-cluster radical SAM maturase HydE [Shewanella fidelis]MDW4811528.1 [FeFe] hydrogenase H-cluster radical SAM maturase HydE [Shewanella fidelis]MDW4815649.1 [FeFe] hydrogenase H-cluster radical SAM maturase HydE [Shewanella fidelis]MDW4819739.1 [FeFe] hydrogenase H-cluster radical SAM maturase HydE [Shewanella fidelis]MDW4824287.1 [FeFe] hydrogenase H-cluster radical SAM maturase HydE 
MSAPSSLLAAKFSQQQIIEFLSGKHDEWLFDQAKYVTQQVFNNQVYIRGIVEFSNHCRNNCHYCGLRSGNRQVSRYRLTDVEILDAVSDIAQLGIGTVVLQSGDDWQYSAEKIAKLIEKIKQDFDIAITLSLGDRKHHELKLWRAAGADRYLLKMESFNQSLFNQCRPHSDFNERLARLKYIQSLGYQTGSGVITDLPGMTDEILAADIITLSNMALDMLACGPFIAHPQTPFAQHANGDVLRSHRVSAILRLMNPGANIPATSSLAVLQPNARELALMRGCNVIMPSFTPAGVYHNYNIYPGKNAATKQVTQRVASIFEQIQHHGLQPNLSRGDSKRNHYVSRC